MLRNNKTNVSKIIIFFCFRFVNWTFEFIDMQIQPRIFIAVKNWVFWFVKALVELVSLSALYGCDFYNLW